MRNRARSQAAVAVFVIGTGPLFPILGRAARKAAPRASFAIRDQQTVLPVDGETRIELGYRATPTTIYYVT